MHSSYLVDSDGTYSWVPSRIGQCIGPPNLEVPMGHTPRTTIADINGDLFPDLLVGVQNRRHAIFLNNGTMFSEANVALPATNDVAQVIVADLVTIYSQRKVQCLA